MKMKVTLSKEEIERALSTVVLAAVGPGWRVEKMGRVYTSELDVDITNEPPEKTAEEKEFESCQL
ncbi:MAG: hypothetical protein V1790_11425 [Planctomycetota bacterium]